MKTSNSQIETIVKSNRRVGDRVKALKNLGFNVQEMPMGSGGVLQEKIMRNGKKRIQIGYGHGRYNYALAVTI